MKDPLRLPFDQYQRYRLVADIARRLPHDGRLRVLDVGGRTGLLGSFLPEVELHLVDLESFPGQERLVLGSGSALPYAAGSFDLVCAFDTLEHVPKRERRAFLEEVRRVSRGWVVLAGPYSSPKVRASEALLRDFLAGKLRQRHRYLEEHFERGLPQRANVERTFRDLGGQVACVGHGNLERWLALMCLELYLDDDPALRGLAEEVYAFYNANLYASDHAGPVYRHAVIGAFEGRPLPDLRGLLDPPAAPRGTLRALEPLIGALIAFDVERDAWRAERSAFQSTVETLGAELAALKAHAHTLETDLTGHRASSAELAAELETLRAHARTVEADLAGHRDAMAEVKRNLRALERHTKEIEGDLDGHRATAAELRAEIERLRAHASALEADLTGHRESLRQREAELESWRSHGANLEAERASHLEALAGSQRRIEELTASELQRRRERDELESQGAALERERLRLEDACTAYREQIEHLRGELDRHREVLTEREARLQEHRVVLAARDGELASARAELTRLAESLALALGDGSAEASGAPGEAGEEADPQGPVRVRFEQREPS